MVANGKGAIQFRVGGNGMAVSDYVFEDEHRVVKGILVYKESAVNYFPGKKVTWIKDGTDTITDVYDTAAFRLLFAKDGVYEQNTLAISNDSVRQLAQDYPVLGIWFENPAVLPWGHWQVRNKKSNRLKLTVQHDENGNMIQCTYYDENGKVIRDSTFPPCPKRKLVRRNPDGSFYGEECPIK